MKKLVYFILLLIIIIPINIKADIYSRYSDSITKATSYITRNDLFKDRSKYLNLTTNKYILDGRQIKSSSVFYHGGMLNKSEYELTEVNDSSYLVIGQKYWTLTEKGSNEQYYVEHYLDSMAKINTAATRSTIFAKSNVSVIGKGTHGIPWEFKAFYIVKATPRIYGTVECSTPYNCSKNKETVIMDKVEEGTDVYFKAIGKSGYKYKGDSCSSERVNFETVTTSNNNCDLNEKKEALLKVSNITRDRECIVEYEPRVYKLSLTTSPTIPYVTKPNPEYLYHKYTVGWFSNKSATDRKLSVTQPTATGYTFRGYYYNDTQVIDENGNIIESQIESIDNFCLDGSDEQKLVANWESNIYSITLDNQGADISVGTTMLYEKYNVGWFLDSNATNATSTITKPEKTGYTFDGYYSSKSGGTQYIDKDGNILASNTQYSANNILFAHWKINSYTITINAGNGLSKVALSGWTNTGTASMTKSLEYGSTLDLSTIIATFKSGYSGKAYVKTSGSGSISGNTFTVGAGVTTITINATTIADPNPSLSIASTSKIYGSSDTTLTGSVSNTYDSGISVTYNYYYDTSSTGSFTNSQAATISKTSHKGIRYYKVKATATDGILTSNTKTSSSVSLTLTRAKYTPNANSCGTITTSGDK